jgi:hypothetical protein
MRTKTFEEKLARMAGIPASEADQRMRPLREAKLLPVGGRGRQAPDMNSVHGAYMLLAMISRRAVDSLPVALRARKLKIANGPLKKGTGLDLMLTYLLHTPEETWLRRLMVAEDGSHARMLTTSEFWSETDWLWLEDEKLEEVKSCPADIERYGSSLLSRYFVIGGGAISMLGQYLQKEPPRTTSGWIDPVPAIELPPRVLIEARAV